MVSGRFEIHSISETVSTTVNRQKSGKNPTQLDPSGTGSLDQWTCRGQLMPEIVVVSKTMGIYNNMR